MQVNSGSDVDRQTLPSAGHHIAITYRPIDELKLRPDNPRLHSKKQIRQIARSITAFHFNVPVLVDGQMRVVAGHGRILAARQLGLTEIPTICLDHLTEAQASAFMIADNRLTVNADWDERLLGEQYKMLSEVDLDFDIETTGFELPEIEVLIEGLTPNQDDIADFTPESEGPRVTKVGDLWLLGAHRVYCGNALEEASFSTLMGDRQAAAVFIDPPYNVPIDGHVSGLGKVCHKDFAMACGEMNQVQFAEFLGTAFGLLARYSKDGALHFVCMDWRHIEELLLAGKKVYRELKNLCIWAKDNAGMGSLYRSQHELIFVFKHGSEAHRNNVQLGKYGRYRTNLWHYPGANSFARATGKDNLLEMHPTSKPVAMVADAIRDCTSRGELILDSFLGSGTTLLAAQKTGRICYGIELNPDYVDIIIRRWQTFTKQVAYHAVTKRSFDELAQATGT